MVLPFLARVFFQRRTQSMKKLKTRRSFSVVYYEQCIWVGFFVRNMRFQSWSKIPGTLIEKKNVVKHSPDLQQIYACMHVFTICIYEVYRKTGVEFEDETNGAAFYRIIHVCY